MDKDMVMRTAMQESVIYGGVGVTLGFIASTQVSSTLNKYLCVIGGHFLGHLYYNYKCSMTSGDCSHMKKM